MLAGFFHYKDGGRLLRWQSNWWMDIELALLGRNHNRCGASILWYRDLLVLHVLRLRVGHDLSLLMLLELEGLEILARNRSFKAASNYNTFGRSRINLGAWEHLHLGGNWLAYNHAAIARRKLIVIIAELRTTLVSVLRADIGDYDLVRGNSGATTSLLWSTNVHESILRDLGLRSLHLLWWAAVECRLLKRVVVVTLRNELHCFWLHTACYEMLLLMIRKIIFLVARSGLLRRRHRNLLQHCSLQLGMLVDMGTTKLSVLRFH